MNELRRARPGSEGAWDRARRAYLAVLGDHDPADGVLSGLPADGVLDLRLGYDGGAWDSSRPTLVSGPDDFSQLREIVESMIGVGTWPRPADDAGRPIRATVEIDRPNALLGLLIAMEGLIEPRSPWGRWRTVVDTMAARVVELGVISVDLRLIEPSA